MNSTKSRDEGFVEYFGEVLNRILKPALAGDVHTAAGHIRQLLLRIEELEDEIHTLKLEGNGARETPY